MSVRDITRVLDTRVMRDLAVVIEVPTPLAVIALVLSLLLGNVSSMEGDPDSSQGICASFFIDAL